MKTAELSSYVINYVFVSCICDILKLTQIASFIVSNLLVKRTHIILMPLITDDHIRMLFSLSTSNFKRAVGGKMKN